MREGTRKENIMEGKKERKDEIDWERLDELASYGAMMGWTESFLAQMADRIDTYIRKGGLDRDIAELNSMFVDMNMDECIKAIGNLDEFIPIGGTLWIPRGDPVTMGRSGGRYGHRLELGIDTADKPGGTATIKAWWVPESREAWISSTASGKIFVGSIVAKLANRENHTVMDTLRQKLYPRLLRAGGNMRARRDASSGRRRIEGEIPEGLRLYIAWCREGKEE